LCTSFLLQPLERIYASETPVAENGVSEIINLAVDAGLTDSENSLTDVLPVDETTFLPTDPVASENEDTSVSDSSAGSENDTLTSSTATSTEDGSPGSEDDIATTTVFTDAEIAELIGEDFSETNEIEEATSSATSTENLVAVSTVFSDAVMQFNKQNCVTVADGSFYCQNKKEEAEQGSDGM